jgi:hypothetical protein
MNPGKKGNTFFPIKRYINKNNKDAIIKLGAAGMNNLSLSLGYS